MKKILFALILAPFLFAFSCEAEKNDVQTIQPSQPSSVIYGSWKLKAIYKYKSNVNMATPCDLQLQKIFFLEKAEQKLDNIQSDNLCEEGTITYDSYSVNKNEITLIRGDVTYWYTFDYDASNLFLANRARQVKGQSIINIPLSEQIRLHYTKL